MKNFYSLAILFMVSLISGDQAKFATLLPTDVVNKFTAGTMKPTTEDIYVRGQIAFTPSGSSGVNLVTPSTRKANGITNLVDGKTIVKNDVFAGTHISFGYAQFATAVSTPDIHAYSNTTKVLSAGAYGQRIPTLVLNSIIQLKVGSRTVYSGLISDLCTDNNVNEPQNTKTYLQLDAPTLITDQDIVEVMIYSPAGGAVVGGTISEWIDVRIHGARFTPSAA
jgi:hypothetical protein